MNGQTTLQELADAAGITVSGVISRLKKAGVSSASTHFRDPMNKRVFTNALWLKGGHFIIRRDQSAKANYLWASSERLMTGTRQEMLDAADAYNNKQKAQRAASLALFRLECRYAVRTFHMERFDPAKTYDDNVTFLRETDLLNLHVVRYGELRPYRFTPRTGLFPGYSVPVDSCKEKQSNQARNLLANALVFMDRAS